MFYFYKLYSYIFWYILYNANILGGPAHNPPLLHTLPRATAWQHSAESNLNHDDHDHDEEDYDGDHLEDDEEHEYDYEDDKEGDGGDDD